MTTTDPTTNEDVIEVSSFEVAACPSVWGKAVHVILGGIVLDSRPGVPELASYDFKLASTDQAFDLGHAILDLVALLDREEAVALGMAQVAVPSCRACGHVLGQEA